MRNKGDNAISFQVHGDEAISFCYNEGYHIHLRGRHSVFPNFSALPNNSAACSEIGRPRNINCFLWGLRYHFKYKMYVARLKIWWKLKKTVLN